MCGIITFIDFNRNISLEELDEATDTMFLRGPDARGTLLLEEKQFNIGFGHRRLAIQDIDERSNQPLIIDNYIIVYNGEIYNFNEIKLELIEKGYSFNTTSDTEVIIQSFREWGKACYSKFLGMFAFVIYDRIKKEVSIVRDRIGVKPLYYYSDSVKLIVASEVKAIIPLLDDSPEIEESSLLGFFSLGYVPGHLSIFKGIKRIKPGSVNKIDLKSGLQISKKLFWDINALESKSVSDQSTEHKLAELLEDSINLRLIADVKVGSFLSGGLDSSYVTKVMRENSKEAKLNSFTIGFKEKFDEAPHAKIVADYIGTEHHTHYLEPSEVEDIILNCATYFDEPFSDDAAIPMLFLSRMSKNDVKVVISSDGGDEVFAGYNRYIKSLKANQRLNKLPYIFRYLLKKTAKVAFILLPKQNRISNTLWRLNNMIDKSEEVQLANILLYGDMIPTPELEKVLDKDLFNYSFKHNYYKTKKGLSPIKQLLHIDLKERLVNQMLVKVDKSTMGASIEGREPLLDHRLFEFMANCSDSDLIVEHDTKYIFKKIIKEKFMGTKILNKPKMGFTTPIYDWLRYSYPEFVEAQFKSINSLSIPYINEEELLDIWQDFKEGKGYYQNLVWRNLVFILWYKKYCLNK